MGKIVLNTNMGDAILNRLRDFTDLPASGYVAGQAVASAVSELFGDGRAVQYNDVDVFRESRPEDFASRSQSHPNSAPRSKTAIRRCDFSTLGMEQSNYGDISETTVKRYQVLGTKRQGMLNEVLCGFSQHSREQFLQTFDLNCVQVGVDLESKELFWTSDFELFNQTRQLDVVTLHTPFHSLIRYFRKKEELGGVYGNDERIIEMLAAAYHIEVNRGKAAGDSTTLAEYSNLRWRFGRIYREKLDAVAGMILPHFSVETEMIHDYPVSILVPRFEPGRDLTPAGIPNLVHCLPKLSRALREKHTPATQARLNHLAKTMDGNSLTRGFWLEKGDAYIKGNVTPAQIVQMDKVASKHFLAHQLDQPTLGEQWQQFNRIRVEASRRGVWVYGVLENTPAQVWTDATLDELLVEQEKLLKQTLTRRTLPPLAIAGFRARELVTGMDMSLEGAEVHHCVAGYAHSVKKKLARIVSLRSGDTPDTWLTVELRKKGLAWTAVQVRGLQNRDSLQFERDAATTYANYSNLAVCLGGFITGQLARAYPAAASSAGARVGAVLEKLSYTDLKREFEKKISPASIRLAKNLGVKHSRAYGGKQQYLCSSQNRIFTFWALALPGLLWDKLRGVSVPEPSAQLAGAASAMDYDDIPF